jgi:nitrate/nitrite transport system ATP-binding protein
MAFEESTAEDFVDPKPERTPQAEPGYLSLRGVSKGFGPPTARSEVLVDINLDVRESEFVAIVGFSGSGKSTLINLLAGLLPADEGRIQLDGRPIVGPGPDRGVVFQS